MEEKLLPKSARTREGDKKIIRVPDLRQNPKNMPIMMAAINGTLSTLKALLQNQTKWPNEELKKYILSFL